MSFLVSMSTNDYIELYASSQVALSGINVHSLQITCA